MKNITTLIAMALLSTMSAATFTACSNDEIDPLTIHGVWQHNDAYDHTFDYISFSADGTGEKWETLKSNDTPDAAFDRETFTYSLNGNKITIIEQDGERDIETLKIINNDRIKLDDDVYNRTR